MKLTTPNFSILTKVIDLLKNETVLTTKTHLYKIVEHVKFPYKPDYEDYAPKNYFPIINWLIHHRCIHIIKTGPMSYEVLVLNGIHSIEYENLDKYYEKSL